MGQQTRQQAKTQALSLQRLAPNREILGGLDGPPLGLTVPSGHDEGRLGQRTLCRDGCDFAAVRSSKPNPITAGEATMKK
jgi:hypothetical protein